MYQYRHIILQMRAGTSNRNLARAGIVSRNKARQIREIAQARGWLDADKAVPDEAILASAFNRGATESGTCTAGESQSLAAAHAQQIKQWVLEGVQASTIYQHLVTRQGYAGSYSSVQRFVKDYKERLPSTITVPLHFNPGEAGQVDFGQGPTLTQSEQTQSIKTWFFIMTLCFSRHQYAELVTDQSVETWLGCHRRAFEWFGGIPEKIIIDNPKCAIVKACYYEPTVQRSYYDYAEQCGFIISPCPVRDPKKKGRVESGVKYAKKNFMPLRQFVDLVDANAQLRDWTLTTAGRRVHGATFKVPLEEFETREKGALKPLPSPLPIPVRWEKVTVYCNCHVRFDYNFYSVSYQYVKCHLWLCASETTIKIYDDHQLIACHVRCREKGNHITVIDHLPPNAQYYFIRSPQWCREQSEHIGQSCHQIVTTLLDDPTIDYTRAAQGILKLSQRYGVGRLEKACERALYFRSGDYKTVKTILEKSLDKTDIDRQCSSGELASVYCGSSKYLTTHTSN